MQKTKNALHTGCSSTGDGANNVRFSYFTLRRYKFPARNSFDGMGNFNKENSPIGLPIS